MFNRALTRSGRDLFQQDIKRMQEEMNRLVEGFFRTPRAEGTVFASMDRELGIYAPRLDVAEAEKEIRVSIELPGLDEKDVEVSLSGEVLTIRGEKRAETEEKGRSYYRAERSYGAFHRSVLLPSEVDSEKIEASFKKGVLTVTLPKTTKAQEQTKKITIKTD